MIPQINPKNSAVVSFANSIATATVDYSLKFAVYLEETIPQLIKNIPTESYKSRIATPIKQQIDLKKSTTEPAILKKIDLETELTFKVMNKYGQWLKKNSEKNYQDCLQTCDKEFLNDRKSRIACKSACFKAYNEQRDIRS